MKTIKQILGGDIRQFGMVLALLVLVFFFQFTTGGKVLTPSNLINLLNGNSYVLVLAIGMVLVIVIGQIDLSVGSVAAVTGIVVALAMRDWGLHSWYGVVAAVLLGLAIGCLIGIWQGFWLAKIGIPGFITTLAGMMIFRGLQQFIGKSNSIPVPKEFQWLGAGYLPEWGPSTGLNNSTLVLGVLAILAIVFMELRKRSKQIAIHATVSPVYVVVIRLAVICGVIGYLTYLFGSGRPGTSFPVSGCILLLLVIFYHIISQRTAFGRHIYAVGGNKAAAALTGVNVTRTYFLTMMNMSILAALAGMIFIGRSSAAGPFDGTNWELDAIASVFIGGAAVSGGIGTVVGSIIGGLVMAVLNNGLQLESVGADMTYIIKGLVLLLAVAFDILSKKQGRFSIIGQLTKKRHAAAEPDKLEVAS